MQNDVRSVANKSVDKGTKHYHQYNNDGNRIELEQSDGEKDIGVFVDENLSFNKHIQNQVNKANSIMGLIRTKQVISYHNHFVPLPFRTIIYHFVPQNCNFVP